MKYTPGQLLTWEQAVSAICKGQSILRVDRNDATYLFMDTGWYGQRVVKVSHLDEFRGHYIPWVPTQDDMECTCWRIA